MLVLYSAGGREILSANAFGMRFSSSYEQIHSSGSHRWLWSAGCLCLGTDWPGNFPAAGWGIPAHPGCFIRADGGGFVPRRCHPGPWSLMAQRLFDVRGTAQPVIGACTRNAHADTIHPARHPGWIAGPESRDPLKRNGWVLERHVSISGCWRHRCRGQPANRAAHRQQAPNCIRRCRGALSSLLPALPCSKRHRRSCARPFPGYTGFHQLNLA